MYEESFAFFFISVPDSPLYPGLAAVLCEAGVRQAHVEEGREHEGEEGDCGPAHQVQNGSEAAHARTRSSFFRRPNQTKPVFFEKTKTKPNRSFFKTPNQAKLRDEKCSETVF